MSSVMTDRIVIRDVIENWAVWRDAGDWERFETVFYPGATIATTFFEGEATKFIELSKAMFARGTLVHHILGGSSIDIRGPRAIAQTKMIFATRFPLDDVACDVECFGRFYDLFENRDGVWAIVARRCIFERDRIDSVDPSLRLELDRELLLQYPEGYRHLAYVQVKGGFKIRRDVPGSHGPEVEELYRLGAAWLADTGSVV